MDGFIGHVDAAFEQEFLHVAVAQVKAIIEPSPVADDFAGKTVVFVALGVDGRGLSGCLSWGCISHVWGITEVSMA
jgi:hypothetical protein